MTDAMGNLIQVIEPNRAAEADLTYTYNAANQLVQVTMPRSNGHADPHLRLHRHRPDQRHQPRERDRDLSVRRVAPRDQADRREGSGDALHLRQVWPPDRGAALGSGIVTAAVQEQTIQRVTYAYDSNPLDGNYSQNAWGRLAAVQFNSSEPRFA